MATVRQFVGRPQPLAKELRRDPLFMKCVGSLALTVFFLGMYLLTRGAIAGIFFLIALLVSFFSLRDLKRAAPNKPLTPVEPDPD